MFFTIWMGKFAESTIHPSPERASFVSAVTVYAATMACCPMNTHQRPCVSQF